MVYQNQVLWSNLFCTVGKRLWKILMQLRKCAASLTNWTTWKNRAVVGHQALRLCVRWPTAAEDQWDFGLIFICLDKPCDSLFPFLILEPVLPYRKEALKIDEVYCLLFSHFSRINVKSFFFFHRWGWWRWWWWGLWGWRWMGGLAIFSFLIFCLFVCLFPPWIPWIMTLKLFSSF